MSSTESNALPEGDAPAEVVPIDVFEAPPPPPKEKSSPRLVATSQTLTRHFSGPMPPPELLARYESICPGSADRIIGMAEKEAEHRRSTETTIVQAQIDANDKEFSESRCGQICALVITLAAIAGGVYTAVNGHEIAGGIIGVGGIGGIVTTFILGKRNENHGQHPPENSQPDNKAVARRRKKGKPQKDD